jgi:hypothetical protein
MRRAGMEEKRDICRVSLGKSEVKRPHGRSRRRRKDNIKMHLTDIEWMICKLDLSVSG